MGSASPDSRSTPQPGDLVRVRARTWLVEGVAGGLAEGGSTVTLACLDDDAQGEELEVVWHLELDAEILTAERWKSIGSRGFDPARLFRAYVHTLRWNCVTATDPRLFQAPFRAGIKIDAYQLEPLRKALLLPRVNLFIADDVGLGKTIEAGLIASELLLRRRVREIVVACPPTMLPQWKDELENRFGLTFEILDREYIERVRRERGYGVNPWTTFPRFLISQRLLIDEAYAAPLRAWLDNLRPGSLLILDEAHHAAPSSGSRYAIDSRITGAVRDLAPRFEHRLFLSATPHNGHSNSFSALLEILDPHRFTRGVKVPASRLNDVMVRRLKDDVREIAGGFPKRVVRQIDLDGLPADAPELVLSRLLDEYREARQRRMEGASRRKQAEAALLISGLQQRLLSSIEAFARTLRVHRRTMERIWAGEQQTSGDASAPPPAADRQLLLGSLDADDDRSQLEESELEALEDQALQAATAATAPGPDASGEQIRREQALLARLEEAAEAARGRPDARVKYLIEWIRERMCAGAHLPGASSPRPGAAWSPLRLLIFTEYDDTKRHLLGMLHGAIAGSELAEHRIEVFHGPTPREKREAIKRAFNLPPDEHPLRILVATDAAREGLNLQAHCWNVFHFDLPWNPSRIEQRNGRVDRKLQPQPEVHCHYFVYPQRPEDRVLQALLRKTGVIREQLGSLSQVLESRLEKVLRDGIGHRDIERLERAIGEAGLGAAAEHTVAEELEAARERQDALRSQVDSLRGRINDARRWIGLDADSLRDALSCSLEMLGARPLEPIAGPPAAPARYAFPAVELRAHGEGYWTSTLDTLRTPPEDGVRNAEWRRRAEVRPVTFQAPDTVDEDTVQLHLQQRVVQRLLGRFVSQGFVHHDLSRACLAQTADAIPRIVLLGRLSLYGRGAVRLHEEMLTVTARWHDPAVRKAPLAPYARDAEARTLDLLEDALRSGQTAVPGRIAEQLRAGMARDIEELLPHLGTRGRDARDEAERRLAERGRIESQNLRSILEDQRRRVLEQSGRSAQLSLELDDPQERRQFEADRKAWQKFLANVEGDLEREPARILGFYGVASARIEPVGLAYLWPVTG